jgi:hydroxyacylglutathione hydrolase
MRPEELAKKIALGKAPAIVDVRTVFEFRAGHIEGAIHAQIWKILLRLEPLPEDRDTEMVVLCALGPRAMIAKVLLKARGYLNVSLLTGHMAGWRRLGFPQESGIKD